MQAEFNRVGCFLINQWAKGDTRLATRLPNTTRRVIRVPLACPYLPLSVNNLLKAVPQLIELV